MAVIDNRMRPSGDGDGPVIYLPTPNITKPYWEPVSTPGGYVPPAQPVLPITQITGYTKCAICKALLLHHDVIAHDMWHEALNAALDL